MSFSAPGGEPQSPCAGKAGGPASPWAGLWPRTQRRLRVPVWVWSIAQDELATRRTLAWCQFSMTREYAEAVTDHSADGGMRRSRSRGARRAPSGGLQGTESAGGTCPGGPGLASRGQRRDVGERSGRVQVRRCTAQAQAQSPGAAAGGRAASSGGCGGMRSRQGHRGMWAGTLLVGSCMRQGGDDSGGL